MAPQVSAGLLPFRFRKGSLEVFLGHPGGPYWTRKDAGAWSLPKGEVEPGEDLLTAAVREFEEETGYRISGEFVALTPIRQPGGKTVHAWAVETDIEAEAIVSNSFSLEWPPRSGKLVQFPELDRAAWFSIEEAHARILTGQRPLLDELLRLTSGRHDPPPTR